MNPPLSVEDPGNPLIADLNRWQPLILEIFIDQSGNEIPGAMPDFLSPEWGQVYNFGLSEEDATTYERDGFDYKVFLDPGAPPQWQADGLGETDLYRWTFLTTLIWSSHLDHTDGETWDISPASLGNRPSLPATFNDHPSFYNQLSGGTQSQGHTLNPATGQPYEPNLVPRADYARVLAEFWADGPDSETPPGHWNYILNKSVTDHPDNDFRLEGEGDPLSETEWNIKIYFALNGAMHDAAVAAWGVKGWYDYIRPISAIRAMADLGQSSDMGLPNYHPGGLPLIEDLIELVESGDPLAGPNDENIGKIKVKAWRGHKVIDNVDTDVAGVDWILAENWVPYQRPSFVTPPFAGYVSGHSTYSRAAAEVLTAFTGDEYFPGGMGTFLAPQNEFLVFEDGPSVDVELQWATYRDAADESGLSRIWGGIHPPADDIPGRIMGEVIGVDAFNKAKQYFEDCVAPPSCEQAPQNLNSTVQSNGVLLNWDPVPNSVACRVTGGVPGSPNTGSVTVLTPGASSVFVNNGALQANTTYRWRVICACQLEPLVLTPWSAIDQFTTGASNISENFGAETQVFGSQGHFDLFPNPATTEVNLSASFEVERVVIYDVTGRVVLQENLGETVYAIISLNGLAKGSYLVEASNGTEKVTRRLLVD